MTRKPAVFLLTALAAAVSTAFAQQAAPFNGSVSITGIATDVTSDNRFRFEEYRDLDDGVTGGFDLRFGGNGWYNRLFGENVGRDDQFIELKGGRYGIFKYTLYGDDIVHNLTFGALTPFNGVGSNRLTFPGPSAAASTATWNRFDYGLQHKNVGGTFEAQASPNSPFYVRVTANRKNTDGIRPLGGAGGSPGGPAYELPAPIDYTTTDVSGEVGYSSRKLHLSANVLWSKFEDHSDFLFWQSPQVLTGYNQEQSTLASDNKLQRISLNGMIKQLPLDSSLALRGTYTKIENSLPVYNSWLVTSGTTGTQRIASTNVSTFEGEIVNKTFSAALNSRLAKDFDSKVYYNWYKRENDSTEVVYTTTGFNGCDIVLNATGTATTTLPTCSTEFFHFKKDNFGAEVAWRVARYNKLTLGIDYTDVERERFDYDRSKETKVFLEWKSGAWDVADFRVKYQHLRRKSDFLLADYPNIFESRFARFDVAPLDRDQIKVSADANPAPLFDLGGEIIYKRNKYKDTFLGRTGDRRHEVAVSASYGDLKALRVTAFADYEHSHYNSRHWAGAVATFPNPNTAGTAYLWESRVEDDNYLVGVGAEWRVNDRLRLVGSAIYSKADGSVDFATQNNLGNPLNIDRYDNFKKTTLNLRGIYAMTKKIDVSLGAAYEKYDYSDIQLDDYIYNIRTGTSQNYFSGAYAFPNYKATIVYLTLTYKF